MASLIQISRGSLPKLISGLVEGQLFWQARNTGGNPLLPTDEGTLYIGRPDLNGGAPIPIGGSRSYRGMVYRGQLSGSAKLTDLIFATAREGDFWVFGGQPPNNSYFNLNGDFRKDDILLVTSSVIVPDTGKVHITGGVPDIAFIKISTSGGRAIDTSFDNTGTSFTATNVQDALKELDLEKLSYRGEISSSGEPIVATGGDRGSLYLITADGVVLPGAGGNITTKKGDFVYWVSPATKWARIPSGFTDAADINYGSAGSTSVSMPLTFTSQHRVDVAGLKTVQDTLTLLLKTKAQIGADGKIPLTQLPDTVLGALQYKGVWNPLLNDNPAGKSDINFQSPWPTAPEDGDYYVVKIPSGTTSIRFYDKQSPLNNGTYSRYIELNNGDWIVWQKSPVEIGNDSYPNGHWESIDNSDRISVLNIITNANFSGADPALVVSQKHELVGSPTIGASHKLCIYDNGGVMTVAGLRLIDQSTGENGRSNFLPRYTKFSGQGTNTVENSNIEDSTEKGTTFHHNVQVGTESAPQSETVYGDINLLPKFERANGVPTRTRGRLNFKVLNYNPAESAALPEDYRTISMVAPLAAENGAELTLPESAATLVGKLKEVAFISGRVVKSIRDGYVESTSIEEHMVFDAATGRMIPDVVEIHAPKATVKRLGLRELVFGQKDLMEEPFAGDGQFNQEELVTKVYSNIGQTSDIEIYWPSQSGTVLTDTSWNECISGDVGTLPVFGGLSEGRMTLINSKIKQMANLLTQSLRYGVGFSHGAVGTPSQDERFITDNITPNKDSNVEIDSDVLIGKFNRDTGELEKRNAHITGILALGSADSNITIIKAGRTLFPEDSQYTDPYTGAEIPVEPVYVEPPAYSGVLLTSNSPIDGGNFV